MFFDTISSRDHDPFVHHHGHLEFKLRLSDGYPESIGIDSAQLQSLGKRSYGGK